MLTPPFRWVNVSNETSGLVSEGNLPPRYFRFLIWAERGAGSNVALGYCEQTARNWALASPAPGVCFNARDILAGRKRLTHGGPKPTKRGLRMLGATLGFSRTKPKIINDGIFLGGSKDEKQIEAAHCVGAGRRCI